MPSSTCIGRIQIDATGRKSRRPYSSAAGLVFYDFIDQIVANPVTSISHGRHLADELGETRLAVPMALTQLGQIAM
jgi:hypothetical protein